MKGKSLHILSSELQSELTKRLKSARKDPLNNINHQIIKLCFPTTFTKPVGNLCRVLTPSPKDRLSSCARYRPVLNPSILNLTMQRDCSYWLSPLKSVRPVSLTIINTTGLQSPPALLISSPPLL